MAAGARMALEEIKDPRSMPDQTDLTWMDSATLNNLLRDEAKRIVGFLIETGKPEPWWTEETHEAWSLRIYRINVISSVLMERDIDRMREEQRPLLDAIRRLRVSEACREPARDPREPGTPGRPVKPKRPEQSIGALAWSAFVVLGVLLFLARFLYLWLTGGLSG